MAGIYIHIPYCKQKCSYCNFHFRVSKKQKDEMMKSMQYEIRERKDYLTKKELQSIYFGGGTPSILNPTEVQKILKTIYTTFRINNSVEITMECNPDDLTLNKLEEYKKLGINRLSIGIQSFDNSELKFMNRAHNSKDAVNSIKYAKKAGFKNITIDLIYGLPNQTINKWERNLDVMFNLDIQHFSAYSLTVEKKTMLSHLVSKKKITLLSEKKVINHFHLLKKKAEKHGFIHYEISNFSLNGHFSKHNMGYWKDKHYLGIGPSAHSYNGNSRRWNISSNTQYISNINSHRIYYTEEHLTNQQKYNEYIFTSLRTIFGVNNNIIREKFGAEVEKHFLNEIVKWRKKKYLCLFQDTYTLTKNGQIFADNIASDLFVI